MCVCVCVCLSARWLENYCRYLLSVWKNFHVTVKGQGQPHLSVGSRSLVRLWAILSLIVRVYLRRLYFLYFMYCFLNCRPTCKPTTSIVLLAETKNSSHRVANLRQLTSIEFNVLIRLIKTFYLLDTEEQQTVPSFCWSWSPVTPNDSWGTARQNETYVVTDRCYFLRMKSPRTKDIYVLARCLLFRCHGCHISQLDNSSVEIICWRSSRRDRSPDGRSQLNVASHFSSVERAPQSRDQKSCEHCGVETGRHRCRADWVHIGCPLP